MDQISIGVDTHKHLIVAVAIERTGRRLESWQGTNDPAGWQQLSHWSQSFAQPSWGIEGAGGYGHGLAQTLLSTGAVVHEINPRWTTQTRRRQRQATKTDQHDALAIARLVQQEGCALPAVQRDDHTCLLGTLTQERQTLVAQATRLRNQLHAHLFQLDPHYRQHWPRLTQRTTIEQLRTYPLPHAPLLAVRAQSVRRVASHLLLVLEQATAIARELCIVARQALAPLLTICGIGELSAAMLAGYLGPGQRFASDAQLAAYAGVAPLETGSAGQVRHRLNRQGHRQVNAIIHRAALTQLRCSAAGHAYVARRCQEGKTEREALRALKRYIVRAIWRQWQRCQIEL